MCYSPEAFAFLYPQHATDADEKALRQQEQRMLDSLKSNRAATYGTFAGFVMKQRLERHDIKQDHLRRPR